MILWKFDVFPKFKDNSARIQTTSGGIISLLVIFWISFLFIDQLSNVFKTKTESNVVIDNDSLQSPRKIYIDIDIEIQSSCTSLHLDLLEADGSTKTDIIDNMTRTRLDSSGITIEQAMEKRYNNNLYKKLNVSDKYCGSCYGALPQGSCCNSCHDVMVAFKKKGWTYFGADRWEQCIKEGYIDFGQERCRFKGSLKVKRGSGVFHFGLGSNVISSNGKTHSHELSSVPLNTSLNHTINKFRVGKKLPNFIPPLEKVTVELPKTESDNKWIVAYYLHFVPSKHIGNTEIDSYRYSVMYSQKHLTNMTRKALPGIHFYYDFSPMKVITKETRMPLRDFLIRMTGIIGGAFSFAAIIDALTFNALSTIEGKRKIGKDL